MADVWDGIIDYVVSEIKALNLSGIGTNVIRQKYPTIQPLLGEDNAPANMPAAIVASLGVESVVEPQYNVADTLSYPVIVYLLDQDKGNQTSVTARNLLWRQTVLRAFVNQGARSLSLPTVYNCKFDPGLGSVLQLQRWVNQGIWQQSLGFRFISVEPRGVGA
jgi:hypothetical protein